MLLHLRPIIIPTTTSLSLPTLSLLSPSLSSFPLYKKHNTHKLTTTTTMNSWLNNLNPFSSHVTEPLKVHPNAILPDTDTPSPGHQFAQFGAGCFWGVELAYQRMPGVTKTEVGYSQGYTDNPSYNDVCSGETNHNEVVRVEYDPKDCSFEALVELFWERHDPTTLNRQGNDQGTQYRSGIYFYTPEQEKVALESKEKQEKVLNRKIVTEILPAKKVYKAEEYHQQYLAKGGRMGFGQSAEKGCKDPIRCYG